MEIDQASNMAEILVLLDQGSQEVSSVACQQRYIDSIVYDEDWL